MSTLINLVDDVVNPHINHTNKLVMTLFYLRNFAKTKKVKMIEQIRLNFTSSVQWIMCICWMVRNLDAVSNSFRSSYMGGDVPKLKISVTSNITYNGLSIWIIMLTIKLHILRVFKVFTTLRKPFHFLTHGISSWLS